MAYHNAVTDKLAVVCFLESAAYFVYSAANQLKWSSVGFSDSKPDALENAFFSVTHVVSVNSSFSMLPSNQANANDVYRLQHGVHNVLHSFIQEDIQYTFNHSPQQEKHYHSVVAPQLELDIPLLIRHKPQHPKEDLLWFYLAEDILTVCAYKGEKLHLANRYEVSNSDELFYFLMLVVETLNLQPEELDVYAIASKDDLEKFNSLFKNYLRPIQPMYENSSTASIQELIAQHLSQCAL